MPREVKLYSNDCLSMRILQGYFFQVGLRIKDFDFSR
jgi:hypothetical protein